MRPAGRDDVPAIAALIRARSVWMREHDQPDWEEVADDLAGQAAHPDIPVWVLTGGDEVIGCTTLLTESPEWLWTAAERAEPALFMTGTVTDPRFARQQLGCRLAWWVLDHAARTGRTWVRRGTFVPDLVRYYRDVQGWHVVREREHSGYQIVALTRRATRIPDVNIATAGI
ncbi:GNAT family N-acetyltransferase [Winogradskya humida]|uniref:GNAT family N-acetyltransferase n=1 Tax=Winogradskya humida TaxID=113566 RepID=UPI0031CEA39C